MKDISDVKAPQTKCNLNNYTKILRLTQLPHWEREEKKTKKTKKNPHTSKINQLVTFSPENPTCDLTSIFKY